MGVSDVINVIGIFLTVFTAIFGGLIGMVMWWSRRNTVEVGDKIGALSESIIELTAVARVSAKTQEVMEKTILTHSEHHAAHFNTCHCLDHRITVLEVEHQERNKKGCRV